MLSGRNAVTTDNLLQLLRNPFTLGLLLGLVFAGLIFYRYVRLKMEMRRYKGHLSDKLEIEGDTMRRLKEDLEKLRKENENLRAKIASMKEMPELRAQRGPGNFRARGEADVSLRARLCRRVGKRAQRGDRGDRGGGGRTEHPAACLRKNLRSRFAWRKWKPEQTARLRPRRSRSNRALRRPAFSTGDRALHQGR